MNPKKLKLADVAAGSKHWNFADDQVFDLSKIPAHLQDRFVADLKQILAAELPAMSISISKERLKAHDGLTEVGLAAKTLKEEAARAGLTEITVAGVVIDVTKLEDDDFVNLHAEVKRNQKR